VAPKISDVQPIPLLGTVNHIEHFAPDGSPATVIKARGNFGSDIYMVLLDDDSLTTIHAEDPKTHKPIHLTGVVAIGSNRENESQVVVDPPPWHGVVFAHGRVGGKPGTLLIRLMRPQEQWGEPGIVDVQVNNLEPEHLLDADSFVFFPVAHWTPTERYCRADFALAKLFGIKSKDLPTADICQ
jgi:hypothetical protein